jgi:hypothetical protein
MLAERGGMPTWERPVPYGYPETIQSAGMVVAPLLAGFTITLIGLIVDTSNQGIRYRDTALLILAGAVAALLAAVQCAYAARQFMVTPDEIEAWWPGVNNAADQNEVTQWWELRAEQLAHWQMHSRWAARFRYAYHTGVVLVLAGLAAVLIPPHGMSTARWVAVVVVAGAALGEALWITGTSLSPLYEWEPGPGERFKSLKRCGRWIARHPPFGRPIRWSAPSYFDELRNARTAGVGMQIERLRETIQESGRNEGDMESLSKKLSAASAQIFEGQTRLAGESLDEFLRTLEDHAAIDGAPVDIETAKGWIERAHSLRGLLP